jgi:uncharacterized protein DUF4159
VRPFTFATGMYASGDWESGQLVAAVVIDSLARHTELEVSPAGVNVPIDSAALFEYPFLYLTGHLAVRFSAAERRNLLRFVDRGGFIFMDDHNHDINGVFHTTATQELTTLFGRLERIPNTHELYRAFFTFEDGPPATNHEMNGWGDNLVHDQLLGIVRGGRIDVLYSNKDYSSEWSMHPESKRFMEADPSRFAVNIVVYALTR